MNGTDGGKKWDVLSPLTKTTLLLVVTEDIRIEWPFIYIYHRYTIKPPE